MLVSCAGVNRRICGRAGDFGPFARLGPNKRKNLRSGDLEAPVCSRIRAVVGQPECEQMNVDARTKTVIRSRTSMS